VAHDRYAISLKPRLQDRVHGDDVVQKARNDTAGAIRWRVTGITP